ncbi:MAG: LpqB family beta-propeller domain-containing protein [Myxococcota bacterium]
MRFAALAILVACADPEPDEPNSVPTPMTDEVPRMAFESAGRILLYDGVETVPIVAGRRPAVSPDGTQIAFVRGDGTNEEIFVAKLDGSDVRQLTNNALEDSKPTWSPDGAQIAFARTDDAGEIWTIAANGSEPAVQVTFRGGLADEPTWGVEGILFVDEAEDPWVTYLIGANDAEPTQRLDNLQYENDVSWGPDGSIVFSAFLDNNQNEEIYVLPSGSDERIQLTTFPGEDDEADVSPDGTQIAFESDRDGILDLYVMAADGSDVRRLIPDLPEAERRRPAWVP